MIKIRSNKSGQNWNCYIIESQIKPGTQSGDQSRKLDIEWDGPWNFASRFSWRIEPYHNSDWLIISGLGITIYFSKENDGNCLLTHINCAICENYVQSTVDGSLYFASVTLAILSITTTCWTQHVLTCWLNSCVCGNKYYFSVKQ